MSQGRAFPAGSRFLLGRQALLILDGCLWMLAGAAVVWLGLRAYGTLPRVGWVRPLLTFLLFPGLDTVSSDETSAAVRDIFDDVRAISEPSGALALAGVLFWVALVRARRRAARGEEHVPDGSPRSETE